mmetsp:Transcript_30563/g.69030  ORF Transcript_30563/g.69030 Transcript_30563/m.69030 type:complete len:724 (-) Transcript_30563:29-2200(-)
MDDEGPIVVGVDIGALESRLTLSSSYDHELIRNRHGGHAAPTAITFRSGRARLLCEDASDPSRGDGNTVGAVDRLLAGSVDEGDGGDVLRDFARYQFDPEKGEVSVPSTDASYGATALAAMVVSSARRNVLSTIARLTNVKEVDDGTARRLHFVFAVPDNYPKKTREALEDAAHAASIGGSTIVNVTEAMAAVYKKKFERIDGGGKVLVVEMGHARTTVAVLSSPGSPIGGEEEEKKDDDGGDSDKSTIRVVASSSSSTLGAALVDVALYDHFLSSHPALQGEDVKRNSRKGQRLLEGCRKLKHLLSMLTEGSVTVENIGMNDTDLTMFASRDLVRKLCQESVIDRLTATINDVVDNSGGRDGICTIELAGGGTRIPMIQSTVNAAIGRDDGAAFSRSLDDTYLAFGASIAGASGKSDMIIDDDREKRRAKLLVDELALLAKDDELTRKDDIRNRIEARVLELRSARHSDHGSLLPQGDDFGAYLDETDNWLFSEECDNATIDAMEAKWKSVEEWTLDKCAAYLDAKKAEAEEKERQMEAEAALAAAEREASAGSDDDGDDDHDTRRLPTKRRMEIVQKNKKEANELFSDGNYRHAAARYAKALTHCSKFFDLGPAEEEEVREVKLSLHLNASLAYIKLDKPDNALRSAESALELDADNVKALYRRASVYYQKRKFDDATMDLDRAHKLAPDDKAVAKLRRLVDGQVAKQKKKEKAMAKKMFG